MIAVSYWGKDCFGHWDSREDECLNPTEADIRAAFKMLKAAASNSMRSDSRSVYWDSLEDYNNGVLTERVYEGRNSWDDRKVELAALRREWIARLKGGEADGNDAD